MRVVVITNEGMDYSRIVETFVNDFAHQTGKALEVLDQHAPVAESLAQTYDILEFPAIMALSDDGQMQQLWTGASLPRISEVSYYA